MMMNIYVANLGKYNEGELVGEWLTLPIDEEELEEAMDRILLNGEYEEVAIHDYETDISGFKIDEFDSIEKLNELAEELDRISEYEYELLNDFIDVTGYDLEDAIEKLRDGEIYVVRAENHYQLGEAVMEMSGDLEMYPDFIVRYFDYESYGSDFDDEVTGGFTNGRYVYTQ